MLHSWRLNSARIYKEKYLSVSVFLWGCGIFVCVWVCLGFFLYVCGFVFLFFLISHTFRAKMFEIILLYQRNINFKTKCCGLKIGFVVKLIL